MIVSHSKKFIFIHIQRTGGSSIINFLKSQLEHNIEIISQHGNAKGDEKSMLLKYPDYFCFSVVRNPWERILSWYLLIHKLNHEGIENERRKFQYFIEEDSLFEKDDPYFHYNQLDYISDANGNLFTNKIYKYENYDFETQRMIQDIGLTGKIHRRINSSLMVDYQEYYTEKSADLIAQKCQKDVEYFGYEF